MSRRLGLEEPVRLDCALEEYLEDDPSVDDLLLLTPFEREELDLDGEKAASSALSLIGEGVLGGTPVASDAEYSPLFNDLLD